MTTTAGAATTVPAAPRSRRWRRIGAVAAIAAVVVAAALYVAGRNQVTPGPLRTDSVDSVSFGQRAGVKFAWGLPVVFNDGDKPAVLDRVRILNATPGLHVVQTLIGGGRRRYLWFGESYTWPSHDKYTDLHPVSGLAVPPSHTKAGRRGIELVFALRADRPGRYTITRIAIDYRVGGRRHRFVVKSGLSVCANSLRNPQAHDCPAVDAT